MLPDIFTLAHRVPIISAAARNKVPAVYSLPDFARDGGLLSYGVGLGDTYRRAAMRTPTFARHCWHEPCFVRVPRRGVILPRLGPLA